MDKNQLIKELLNLNNQDIPYKISYDSEKAYVDYNLVDAKWIEFWGKAGIIKTNKYILRFDEGNKEIKYTLETANIEWKAGVPYISGSFTVFRGQQFGWESGAGFGLNENGSVGKTYEYSVDYSNPFKDYKALTEVVDRAGWKFSRDYSDPSIIIAGIFAFVAIISAVAILAFFFFRSINKA